MHVNTNNILFIDEDNKIQFLTKKIENDILEFDIESYPINNVKKFTFINDCLYVLDDNMNLYASGSIPRYFFKDNKQKKIDEPILLFDNVQELFISKNYSESEDLFIHFIKDGKLYNTILRNLQKPLRITEINFDFEIKKIKNLSGSRILILSTDGDLYLINVRGNLLKLKDYKNVINIDANEHFVFIHFDNDTLFIVREKCFYKDTVIQNVKKYKIYSRLLFIITITNEALYYNTYKNSLKANLILQNVENLKFNLDIIKFYQFDNEITLFEDEERIISEYLFLEKKNKKFKLKELFILGEFQIHITLDNEIIIFNQDKKQKSFKISDSIIDFILTKLAILILLDNGSMYIIHLSLLNANYYNENFELSKINKLPKSEEIKLIKNANY